MNRLLGLQTTSGELLMTSWLTFWPTQRTAWPRVSMVPTQGGSVVYGSDGAQMPATVSPSELPTQSGLRMVCSRFPPAGLNWLEVGALKVPVRVPGLVPGGALRLIEVSRVAPTLRLV